eukprot:2426694-Rhodomonas_salina.3
MMSTGFPVHVQLQLQVHFQPETPSREPSIRSGPGFKAWYPHAGTKGPRPRPLLSWHWQVQVQVLTVAGLRAAPPFWVGMAPGTC